VETEENCGTVSGGAIDENRVKWRGGRFYHNELPGQILATPRKEE